ncbi:MAG: hypothetical protein CYPHOPRED_001598 [Cyphobasidiales sp. Tagirdzhanova-0007]|nr:MAG: hypothetical protein CYPHOPRED_001598 [Cyphobasidiales sp. Tagirdzhanova-0007]
MSSPQDEHADDAAMEAAAANDAFGLNSLVDEKEELINGPAARKIAALPAKGTVANPDVLTEDLSRNSTSVITRPTDTLMNINLTYEDMTRPVEGPENVLGHLRGGPSGAGLGRSYNTLTGHVEQQAMSDVDFRNQEMSFNVLGFARNASILGGDAALQPFVGDVKAAMTMNGQSLRDFRPPKSDVKATKRKRKNKGKLGTFDDPDKEKVEGEQSDEEEDKAYMGPWAGWKDDVTAPLIPEEEEYALPERRAKKGPIIEKSKKDVGFGEEKSVFHGKSMHDYQGRTYMSIPRDVDVNLTGESGSQECYLPKTCIHTWSGHTKGVTAVRLFPESGHLMLSSSMDTRVKLWDVYHEGKCLRTYMGHGQSVRDVNFNNDGSQFLSAGYDRNMKLWDTETGACIQAFSNGKIPYCIKFNPDPDKQNIFLAGMSDKKIVQYDTRSGEITQEYDQHLGPVNTITFIDENRRFVTTSDDKSVRAWDFDIPVVIKYIAEPYMHSMPAVGVHPSQKWLAMQSLDNQILIYSSPDLKQNRKKRFAGHSVAGYACEVQWSPDGKFLSSGDGSGDVVFWQYQNSRLVKRLKAHSKAVISHAWLPHETSKIVTGSWDGLVKLWD